MSTSGSQKKATFVLPSLPPGILYTVNRGHISRSKTSTSPPPPLPPQGRSPLTLNQGPVLLEGGRLVVASLYWLAGLVVASV